MRHRTISSCRNNARKGRSSNETPHSGQRSGLCAFLIADIASLGFAGGTELARYHSN